MLNIHECTLREAFEASLLIPEFEPWYSWEKWQERCKDKQVIALCAYVDGSVAGCKVGYYEEDHFYSWVGGVLPGFRKSGVASALADVQEELVRKSGMRVIRMKTRNRFVPMLRFALGRGFHIIDVEQKGEPLDWRITLYKNL